MYKLILALPFMFALAACGSDSADCLGSSTQCAGTCVDTAHDQLNCGGCGIPCGAEQVCSDGACVDTQACLVGATECGGTCVNLASDRANCGACGNTCAAGLACSNGACAPTCALLSSPCGGACVDLTSDRDHCGGCGVACDPGELCLASACVLQKWQRLTDLPQEISSVSSNVPDGESSFYFTADTKLWRVDPPDTLVPLADLPDLDDYLSLARLGGTLYIVDAAKLYAYSIANNTWSTPITDLGILTNESQTAVDDGGFLYSAGFNSIAGKYQLVKIDSSDMSIDSFDLPASIGNSEPRVVWDHLSARVYVADYDEELEFYAFNPATNQFSAALEPIPPASSNGFSDATCSDNRGHIYAGTGDGSNRGINVYTAGADNWWRLPDLPFDLGNNATCVLAAGWLYVSNSDNSNPIPFARYPVGK